MTQDGNSRATRWHCNDNPRLTAQLKSALDHHHQLIITPPSHYCCNRAIQIHKYTDTNTQSPSALDHHPRPLSQHRTVDQCNELASPLVSIISHQSPLVYQLPKYQVHFVSCPALLCVFVFVWIWICQYLWRWCGKAITWHPPLQSSPVFPWSVSNAGALCQCHFRNVNVIHIGFPKQKCLR